MKKIFTLFAVAMTAMCASAQTETFSAYTFKQGTVAAVTSKADSVIFNDSVISIQATPNVKLEAVSSPDLAIGSPYTWTNAWGTGSTNLTKDAEGNVTYFNYVTGKGNPYIKTFQEEIITNGEPTGKYRAAFTYYEPDGSVGLPKHGLYYTLTPQVAGTFKVGIWINKGSRKFFIVDKATGIALDTTMYKASGYINGKMEAENTANRLYFSSIPHNDGRIYKDGAYLKDVNGKDSINAAKLYVIGDGNQVIWAYITFKAEANKSYLLFLHSAQLGFQGFEFTPGDSSGIKDDTETIGDDHTPLFNLSGQQVDSSYKGIIVKKGKKYPNR
jgi:hypothetical protein